MAKSESNKRVMNLLYGIGASVVIVGALFKIMHWQGGSIMLIVGLITEAFIFFVSAFETPDKDLDWTLVYPELAGGEVEYEYDNGYQEQSTDMIAAKIDELFEAANIDSTLLNNLSGSIKNLEKTANHISQVTDTVDYTKGFNEELGIATEKVKHLNEFYNSQLENTESQVSAQTTINNQIIDVSTKIKEQMQDLATNLSSLNTVYGNMLSAMKK